LFSRSFFIRHRSRKVAPKFHCAILSSPPSIQTMVPDTFFFLRVALIHALIPLGLKAVAEALEAEVTNLAGERYSRTGR
jgi:hypothetical protein